ncbi:MAG: dihydroorotate dehydrogenase electron transfer subunit [Armatimonadetes bacterium]|nr:dihydroorotate dehydrogenase electron transfer subunit [Armatimonadota bacterium]
MNLTGPTSQTAISMLAPLVAIKTVAPLHFQMSLLAPVIASRALAGQFVHVLPRNAGASDPFLRRAFSIMATRGDEIDILFRVEGRGTRQLSMLRVGDNLDVLGPLGRPFDLSLFHVKHPLPAILVGGGVGVPPLVFLAQTLHARRITPLTLIGARTASDVVGEGEFSAVGVETRLATDDGSVGHHGRVTHLLEQAMGKLPDGSRAVIYACGPYPMLQAVATVAARYGAPCQVSLEENMPCGIGVCNGCVVAMKPKQNEGDYGRYRRICLEGPALWAHEIEWGKR